MTRFCREIFCLHGGHVICDLLRLYCRYLCLNMSLIGVRTLTSLVYPHLLPCGSVLHITRLDQDKTKETPPHPPLQLLNVFSLTIFLVFPLCMSSPKCLCSNRIARTLHLSLSLSLFFLSALFQRTTLSSDQFPQNNSAISLFLFPGGYCPAGSSAVTSCPAGAIDWLL
jgi:hypothetical protein